MIDTDIDAEVTALARRHRELGEVIAELTAQRDALKGALLGIRPGGHRRGRRNYVHRISYEMAKGPIRMAARRAAQVTS